jgi:hypothetical protein
MKIALDYFRKVVGFAENDISAPLNHIDPDVSDFDLGSDVRSDEM